MRGTHYVLAAWGMLPAVALSSACVIPISNGNAGDAAPQGDSAPGTTAEGGAEHDSGGGGDHSVVDAHTVDGTTEDGNSSSDDGGIPDEAGIDDVAAPPGGWKNVTANLAGMSSECASLSLLATKPDEDLLIASVFNVGLFATKDGDGTWEMLSTGTGSAPITHSLSAIAWDPTDTTRFWECGIHGSGVAETTDDGQVFTVLGDISNNDTISVDFSDPNRQTILVGSHETPQQLWLSTNGGAAWKDVGSGLPAMSYCTFALLIDPKTYLVGCTGQGTGPSGVYRTTDGTTWKMVTSSGGGTPPLVASDGSIYWVSPGGAGMTRSTDNGVTWTDPIGSGVIAPFEGSITAGPPVELPDGRLAVMGLQYILLSADHGVTWTPVTSSLPITPNEDIHGVVYSSQRKAFYIWHNSCGNGALPVLADAVMRFDFDYTKM